MQILTLWLTSLTIFPKNQSPVAVDILCNLCIFRVSSILFPRFVVLFSWLQTGFSNGPVSGSSLSPVQCNRTTYVQSSSVEPSSDCL